MYAWGGMLATLRFLEEVCLPSPEVLANARKEQCIVGRPPYPHASCPTAACQIQQQPAERTWASRSSSCTRPWRSACAAFSSSSCTQQQREARTQCMAGGSSATDPRPYNASAGLWLRLVGWPRAGGMNRTDCHPAPPSGGMA